MKILTIIGARPQFIKAATISRIIKNSKLIEEVIVHTGQHFDSNMSDVFFQEMDIPLPNYNLGLGGGNHGQQTGQMLIKIEEILLIEKPDWVLVYGDTNSTLAGALAAVKLHIKLAHVEAGLRSFNKKMPEEINRILTDNVSDALFTPTSIANSNLSNEGFEEEKIYLVGDVMYDAALFYGKKADENSIILDKLKLIKGNFILATIHRAENTDKPERLKLIFDNLEKVAINTVVILPLHPRTKGVLNDLGFNFKTSKIRFVEPLGYIDMVMLEKNAELIVTDSGGVQKEAFFHKVPCVTLRNETEWVELVEKGYNVLWKEDSDLEELLKTQQKVEFANAPLLYGNGDSASEIIAIINEIT
ncbi:UDP-N-acetylglucosamine 2-epimerase (non-hydrolyzing) [Cellulophaga lytica]|nr:UDP-N-acetylglucosamine 2-epimerase (non-hydrolyzing) [Cellulophaga lytica]